MDPKKAEDKLFANMSPELRKLQKQAHKELRLKKRTEWKLKNLQPQ